MNFELTLFAGYRFFIDNGGAEYDPRQDHVRPVKEYLVRLDDNVADPQFDGGAAVTDRTRARLLTDQSAALKARWVDPTVAPLREFALFLLAGTFALGISMALELIKPTFLVD